MTRDQIHTAFQRLNEELRNQGIRGEIGVVGGAAMVLAFNAREATKDVGAVFEPSIKIREIAKAVSAELGLPPGWINDAVKDFMSAPPEQRQVLLDLSHLSVWMPPAQYLLAMKAISARYDSNDAADLRTLITHLKIKSVEQVFELIEHYYPLKLIPAKTQFFLEELFEG